MADVSLVDPYSAQQESIARRRRMAQALQQQAQTPLETPQTPGVLLSPYAGLAKVLQGLVGGYQEAEADKEYKALAEEARTNQATDFAKVIGALKAPGQEAIAGQEASDFVPASYTPERVSTANYARTVIPEEFTPAIRSKPAIAPQDAREAGYIGPDLIASLKDPSMRQFAMAQAMAKLEPKAPISVAPGSTLLDSRTLKPVFTANAAPQRPVALGEGQNLYDSNGKLLVTGTPKTTSATPSKLAQLQAEYDAIAAKDKNDPKLITWGKAIAKEAEDQRLVFDQVKFEYEKGNPGFTLERIKNKDGSESVMAVNKGSAVARTVVGPDGKALTSAAQEKTPIYSDVVRDGKIYKMDLNKPESKDNLIFVKDQSPDLMEVKTTKDGKNVTIYVNKSELKGIEYPEQYSGIIRDLLQAQDIMKYQKDPNVIALVGAALNKGAGLPTQEDVANYLLQLQKAKAELSYSNIPLGNVGPPLQAAPNVLTGQYPSGSAAPAAAVDTKNKWLKN
jgi:hypothetical protein